MNHSHWSPHVTVATVIFKNDRYLMVEERPEAGIVFNQPAGHWEQGETLTQAAERETLEETGHITTLTGILGLSHLDTQQNGAYLRITFFADNATLKPAANLDDGIIAAHWLTYNEIIERRARLRSPLVLNDIERHRSGHTLPLDLLFHAEIA